jgi:hypothetical protein
MSDSTGVVDLLGVLAYAELSAFDRLADDARMAPSLATRARMSSFAATELGHYEQLATRLRELGADPFEAMAPFVAALETFHSLTEPQTWLEAVVKTYVGDGLAADFYGEAANLVDDPETGALIRSVLTEAGRAEFAISEIEVAVAFDPTVRGRLALWARRLLGEAISQTQHVLADREALMVLMMKTGDLTGVAALIKRITQRHGERMTELGLDS